MEAKSKMKEKDPSEASIQVVAPNHHKLLWPKSMVVSVMEKGRARTLSGKCHGDE